MAGLYIHIPFCKKLCSYCDFYFSVSLANKDEMLTALAKEIADRKDYLGGETISTLYFGGGTPTIYSSAELKRLADKVMECYPWQIEELTVEANPDDLTPKYLRELRAMGANRLSIGIQSFIERDLALMNRRHDAQMALDVVPMAQAAGFDNISIDLIYGIPGQTEQEWMDNLDTALSLNVQHISSYHLSIEPKTVFGNQMRRGLFHPIDDEASERLYRHLEDKLTRGGFEHYEVSNFAKPGFYSKHNTSYWTYAKYIGIGPSAHSFDGASRQWNVANNKKYLNALAKNLPYWEREQMTTAEQYNELILTSLRTAWGISKKKLERRFGERLTGYFYKAIEPYTKCGKLIDDGDVVRIPTEHFLLSDGIMADLFFVEP
ncbi:radical SAM family heme chaperone HemW [uncultured Acetobacteroides sp.]|uniref:radical SAM family heme chaperone HemW n=1 Tax=uncultured Acetobacteroides sp. TaxID=1760811 RepID=UPI0029F49C51|nr:radical SAM family heme chaperone HemW [uncultured Acetobacteroides sp.]